MITKILFQTKNIYIPLSQQFSRKLKKNLLKDQQKNISFVDKQNQKNQEGIEQYSLKEIQELGRHEKHRSILQDRQGTIQTEQMLGMDDDTRLQLEQEKRIHKKILEGKKDIDIMREIILEDQNIQEAKKFQNQNKNPDQQEFFGKNLMDFPLFKQYEDQPKILEQIKQETPYVKDLTELPYKEHIQKQRNLSIKEKAELDLKLANLQAFKDAGGMKIDGKYPDLAYSGFQYYENKDGKFSYEEQQKLRDQVIYEETEKQQIQKQQKKKQKKALQKLKLEALDFDTLKDNNLKQLAEKDHQKSYDILEKTANEIEQNEPAASFIKFENKMEKFQQKFGLDIIDLEEFSVVAKEAVFSEKKLQEEQIAYKKYIQRKQKQQEFNKYNEMLHDQQNQIKDDYDEEEAPDKKNNSFKNLLDVMKQEKEPKFDELNLEDEDEEEEDLSKDEKKYDYFRTRYEKNATIYLNQYFEQLSGSQSQYLGDGLLISIDEVYLNHSCTVINAFYRINDLQLQSQEINPDKRLKIHNRLEKHSKYLAGKVCQSLYLKYTPELRFFESKLGQVDTNANYEVFQVASDIAKSKLREYGVKNIKKQELQELEQHIQNEMLDKLRVDNSQNEQQLIKTKTSKVLKDNQGKRVRNNKDESGNKIKSKKKPKKSDLFWDGLQD